MGGLYCIFSPLRIFQRSKSRLLHIIFAALYGNVVLLCARGVRQIFSDEFWIIIVQGRVCWKNNDVPPTFSRVFLEALLEKKISVRIGHQINLQTLNSNVEWLCGLGIQTIFQTSPWKIFRYLFSRDFPALDRLLCKAL